MLEVAQESILGWRVFSFNNSNNGTESKKDTVLNKYRQELQRLEEYYSSFNLEQEENDKRDLFEYPELCCLAKTIMLPVKKEREEVQPLLFNDKEILHKLLKNLHSTKKSTYPFGNMNTTQAQQLFSLSLLLGASCLAVLDLPSVLIVLNKYLFDYRALETFQQQSSQHKEVGNRYNCN